MKNCETCLPFLSFELVSLKLCTPAAPLSLLEHQRPELKNNTTFGRKSYSITFVCMVENKKGGQSIFFCFWALNKYPWSHIHLQQGSSKAQKACTVITSVSAYISEIGVEKQHDIYQYASKFYSLKSSSLFLNKKQVNRIPLAITSHIFYKRLIWVLNNTRFGTESSKWNPFMLN